jgi:hypothetical protein
MPHDSPTSVTATVPQWGSILTAVDKRMKTSILMVGVAQFGDVYLRTSDPGLTDFRKTQPAGQLEKYCEVLGQVDAIHFVGNAAPIPILLQFANYEQYFDKASMQHYISTAIRKRSCSMIPDTI